MSLEEAQQNYAETGAVARRHQGEARPPLEWETREAAWRPIDPGLDNIEVPMRGVKYGDTYPFDDTTVLYYWRPTYWRRFAS